MLVVFQFVTVNLRGSSKEYTTQLKLVKWKDSIVLLIVLVNVILNWIQKDCKFMKKLVRNFSNWKFDNSNGKWYYFRRYSFELDEFMYRYHLDIYKDASPVSLN